MKRAFDLLESPAITARVTDLLGSPVEWAVKKLPIGAQAKIHSAVDAALHKAVKAALWTMDEKDVGQDAWPLLHKAVAATTGAVGGAAGLVGLPFELPITTTVMMRSIADIARSEGFNVGELRVQLECVHVFGLSGTPASGADAGYFAARVALQKFAEQVAAELGKQAAKEGAKLTQAQAAKWLAEMIAKVAARFEIVITEKIAAQAAPVIGAALGALLNTLFIDFYQDMARGHFIISRLALKYGEANVEKAYRELDPRRAAQ